MRISGLLVALLLGSWCLLVAVRWGDSFDESEHAHAAWLMGARGLRPRHDFFQHHQPLLWDVLKIYYVAGGDGPEVLYFGRALVVASALAFGLGVMALSRRLARFPDETAGPAPAWPILGLLPVVALSLTTPGYFVTRPESPGTALFVLALVAWVGARPRPESAPALRYGPAALAGALFGACVLLSPRFAPLAGAFLLLPREPGRPRPGFRDLLALGCGFLLGVGGYMAALGYTPADFYFNVAFTHGLAGAGAGSDEWRARVLLYVIVALVTLFAVGLHLGPRDRPRFAAYFLFLLLLLVTSLAPVWPYLYPQSLAAPACWACVMLAAAEGRIDWSRSIPPRLARFAATLACVLAAALSAARALGTGETIVARVTHTRAVLAKLRPGDRVMASAAHHPICAEDASFYGIPLVDARDRMGDTLDRLGARWGLPPCDYLGDILRRRPAIIDGCMLLVLPERDVNGLERVLREDYEADSPAEDGRCRPGDLYFRRRSPLAEGPALVSP